LPALSKDQLDILVSHALAVRDKVVLNLLWYSGMRLSEVASVKAVISTGKRELSLSWAKATGTGRH
jgi:site-specific recombinase XerC